MSPENYPGIAYLNSLQQWHGAKGFNLDNISLVLNLMGNPQDRPMSVHVAGTNGKGSVSVAIASILGHAGLEVALNTSPHLADQRERFVRDGMWISETELSEAGLRLKETCENSGVKLSYHEAVTAVFFEVSKSSDWTVVEVGLGGRLDASNVLSQPRVGVITSVALDHQHILGSTLREIAIEKAGIIKPGQAVVLGALNPEAAEAVMEVADRQSARVLMMGRDFKVEPQGENSFRLAWSAEHLPAVTFSPSLKGAHQIENMAVAAASAQVIGVETIDCFRGIQNVFWPGRLELVRTQQREVWFDCAHNVAGIEALTSFLDTRLTSKPDIIFGALKTKEWKKMVDILIPYIVFWNIVEPESSQAVEGSQIEEYLLSRGCCVKNFGDLRAAAIAELVGVKEGRSLLVAGSAYLAGHLRALLGVPTRPLWQRRQN